MPVLIGISLYVTALLTIKIGIKTGMAFMAVSLIATGNFTYHVQFSLNKVDRMSQIFKLKFRLFYQNFL